MLTTHKKRRAAKRGAAMVEAVMVISVFILFFLGMVYFRSMYQQKLRMMRLARAAAVGYALNGCNGSPTQNITQDLGSASDNSSGTSQGGANVSGAPGANPSVGQNSGTPPIGAALQNSGMVGDPIAGINLQAPASGTSKPTPWAQAIGFKANVTSTSYMSCGEQHQPGSFSGLMSYVGSLFNSSI